MFDSCIILDLIFLIVFVEGKKLQRIPYTILSILLLLPVSLRPGFLLSTFFLNNLNLFY